MIELHYYPGTAAMVPHILLEEIGKPYRHVGPYLERMLSRDAVQRVIVNEKLAPPFV